MLILLVLCSCNLNLTQLLNFYQKRELELAISEDDVDDDLFLDRCSEGLNMNDMLTPSPGGPFSALTCSMWPQDIMAKISVVPDDPNSQPEYR